MENHHLPMGNFLFLQLHGRRPIPFVPLQDPETDDDRWLGMLVPVHLLLRYLHMHIMYNLSVHVLNMCIHIYIYMYVCIIIYIYLHTCVLSCIYTVKLCIYLHMCLYMYVYIYNILSL